MHKPADFKRHLEHRTSILREFIDGRKMVSRAGFNCYMDSALITCRSLWALLGVFAQSRGETDLKNPTATTVDWQKQKEYHQIRDSISSAVVIKPFANQTELDALPDNLGRDIVTVLAAANKCVAHLDSLLDHGVTDDLLEKVARRLLHELADRVQISAQDVR